MGWRANGTKGRALEYDTAASSQWTHLRANAKAGRQAENLIGGKMPEVCD